MEINKYVRKLITFIQINKNEAILAIILSLFISCFLFIKSNNIYSKTYVVNTIEVPFEAVSNISTPLIIALRQDNMVELKNMLKLDIPQQEFNKVRKIDFTQILQKNENVMFHNEIFSIRLNTKDSSDETANRILDSIVSYLNNNQSIRKLNKQEKKNKTELANAYDSTLQSIDITEKLIIQNLSSLKSEIDIGSIFNSKREILNKRDVIASELDRLENSFEVISTSQIVSIKGIDFSLSIIVFLILSILLFSIFYNVRKNLITLIENLNLNRN